MVRVRFAPSPTGIPHVGSMRTVLFNYFFAKSQQGKFILRIEDTDQQRKVEGALESIKESLEWLGVVYDEYYVQSERLTHYKEYADALVKEGKARIDDGAVRFIVPKKGVTSWIDAVGNKRIEFENDKIEDFIILKKDGFPTYHLANVIDDHLMEISHVIRGDDWIPSAPKHIMLYEALGWKLPVFAHLPNVLGEDGKKKLSKRHGAKSAIDFKNEGILPDALVNYLMLLGWTPPDDREILTRDEIIHEFKLEDVNVSPATFDEKKLLWINGVYIREKLSDEELVVELKSFYSDGSIDNYIDNREILSLAKTRMERLADFRFLVEKADEATPDPEIVLLIGDALEGISDNEWVKDNIFSEFKIIMNEKNVRMPVFYEVFTGRRHGLPLPDFLESLGKKDSMARINR